LTGAPATDLGRYWSAIQLVVSLFLALVIWSVVWSPIFVLIALGSFYGLLRRAKPGFYVELQDDGTLINMAVTWKIAYRDIRGADFYVYRVREFVRAVGNVIISIGRPFGGHYPPIEKFGEIDHDSVELRFVHVLWAYIPFPPFLIPIRSPRLRVEDAPGLLKELHERLPRGASDPSSSL
jgi:hypothetical protein